MANRSGAAAEHIIACILDGRDYRQQVPLCDSIYGHPMRVDFVVMGLAGYPCGIAIEVKRQGVSGSVDEKIPYAIANIKEVFPIPGLLVLDGSGMKPGCRRWAKKQIRTGENLAGVVDVVDFASWLGRR